MYATKRKLHNLLQAATGSGPGGTHHDRTEGAESTTTPKASPLSRFRSKSTANLSKNRKGDDENENGNVRSPRTSHGEISRSSIEVVLGGGKEHGGREGEGNGDSDRLDIRSGAKPDAGDVDIVEEIRKKRNKITESLNLLEKDMFSSLTIRPASPSTNVVGGMSRGSTVHLSEKPTPNYAPWDRAQFLERLSTYRFVDKWSAKPTAVNEVEWAKRGWTCVEKNRVRCTVCSREVVVKVDGDGDEIGLHDAELDLEIYMGVNTTTEASRETKKAIVEKYKEMMNEEHEDYCLWRKKWCADSIYHLQLSKSSESRPQFFNRYKSLVSVQKELPTSLSQPHELSSVHYSDILIGLHRDYDKNKASLSTVIPSQQAFILALFGWQSEEPSIPSLLTCSSCFRRLGLWLFKQPEPPTSTQTCRSRNNNPIPNSNHDNSNNDDSNSRMSIDITSPTTIFPVAFDATLSTPTVSRLDVSSEHREYCPWINAKSQYQNAEPGWKILLSVLEKSQQLQSTQLMSLGRNSNINQAGEAGEFATRNNSSPGRPTSTYSNETGESNRSGDSSTHGKDRDAETKTLEKRLKRLKTIYLSATGSGGSSSAGIKSRGSTAPPAPAQENKIRDSAASTSNATAAAEDVLTLASSGKADTGTLESCSTEPDKEKDANKRRSRSKSLRDLVQRARSKSKGTADETEEERKARKEKEKEEKKERARSRSKGAEENEAERKARKEREKEDKKERARSKSKGASCSADKKEENKENKETVSNGKEATASTS